MIRQLSYINIFVAPIYFLVYFKDAQNYMVAAGLAILIIFCVLLLRQDNAITFKNSPLLVISALLNACFTAYFGYWLFGLITSLDFDYLTTRMATYASVSLLYLVSMVLQLYAYGKRWKVERF